MVLPINKFNRTKHVIREKKKKKKDIKWEPVSNIPVEEIYKDLPEVKKYHDLYEKLWLKGR